MRSSVINSIDMGEAYAISRVAKMAAEEGLLTEWFAFFVGGVKAGIDPEEAAHRAADEWDI